MDNLHPSLRSAIGEAIRDPDLSLSLSIPVEEPAQGQPHRLKIPDRRELSVGHAEQLWEWRVESLATLFRGNRKPPEFGEVPPREYEQPMMALEYQLSLLNEAIGDRRDAEMEELYSTLRRRPDGKSLGPIHDALWQAAAFMLGLFPLSAAEFETLIGRLERSTRRFAMGPSSRNYAAVLRGTFHGH
ncbi:MAG: hypothetical protein KIT22_04370 [Verrucomicrobiae bacterium]|nr:hypothetical protein [Verrucomicrobiae bacterium]